MLHCSGVDEVLSNVSHEVTLSFGQEVNNMCDKSHAKAQDSVTLLWASWAELGLGEVEEGKLSRSIS